MAQTTGHMNGTGGKIEFSSNSGGAFTEISGSVNAVDPGELVRQVGQVFTAEGDKALIAAGKQDPLEISVNIVYTETASEAFDLIETVILAGEEDGQLRWSPAGGASGDDQFTTDDGIVRNLQLPGFDAGVADPLVLSFTFITPGYTKSTVA
jgi:hypothetical protein